MTLHNNRDRPKRPPMPKRTFLVLITVIVVVFVFVAITLMVSGQSFF